MSKREKNISEIENHISIKVNELIYFIAQFNFCDIIFVIYQDVEVLNKILIVLNGKNYKITSNSDNLKNKSIKGQKIDCKLCTTEASKYRRKNTKK